jgi:hypothetical protein
MVLLDIAQRTSQMQRLGLALAGVLAATILVEVVHGPSTGVPFFAFYPVILFATYFGGGACGTFALITSLLSVWFFLVPTVFSFELETPLSEKRLLLRAAVGSVLAVSAYVVRRNVLALEVTRRRDAEIARRAVRSQERYSTDAVGNLDWLARFVAEAAAREAGGPAGVLLAELGARIEILKSVAHMSTDAEGRIDAASLLRSACHKAGTWHAELTIRFTAGSPVHIETHRALAVTTAVLAALDRIARRGAATVEVGLARTPAQQVLLSLDWMQEPALPPSELIGSDELVLVVRRLDAASWSTPSEPPAVGCRLSFPVDGPEDGVGAPL